MLTSASTGIAGEMTFGSGQLDDYGYWEFSNRQAAKEFDDSREQRLKELNDDPIYQNMSDEDRRESLHWAISPAWPPEYYNMEQHKKDWENFHKGFEDDELWEDQL